MRLSREQILEGQAYAAKVKLQLLQQEAGWNQLMHELNVQKEELTKELCNPLAEETRPYLQGFVRGQLKIVGQFLFAAERWQNEKAAAEGSLAVMRKSMEDSREHGLAFGADPEAASLIQQGLSL